MKNSKSNTELLLQLEKGDRGAFYHIYERYCKRLYVFVFRYIKVEVDAKGIVQEVFIKIWESRNKIDAHASFESFLFTIAYNRTISLLRKRANEQKYLEHLKYIEQIQKAPDLIDEIQLKESNEKVKTLLNELTPCQKEIFQLSRKEGLTHEEIGKNYKTVHF